MDRFFDFIKEQFVEVEDKLCLGSGWGTSRGIKVIRFNIDRYNVFDLVYCLNKDMILDHKTGKRLALECCELLGRLGHGNYLIYKYNTYYHKMLYPMGVMEYKYGKLNPDFLPYNPGPGYGGSELDRVGSKYIDFIVSRCYSGIKVRNLGASSLS